jgi:RimJ/RimL family protein N-acetyltransferase
MLESENIILRPFEEKDLEKWTSWFNDKDTTLYMNKRVFPNTLAQQEAHLKNSKVDKNNLQLAITLKNEERSLIGSIGIHKIDWVHRTGDISILIGEKIGLGKGIGKEAIKILVNHAFLKMNMRKITAGMWSENIGSKKAFEANGFILEGTRREQYEANNQLYDNFEYGLLKSDWKE